jgi:predicted  nucleic acid-binding Zn-ribbon protein
MNIVGPSRLVLLRSGKYDYGEVELASPLHLVGANNVGKTSLIAVLQFLYLDDQRTMHFSREMAETRRYYFPDHNSYILFECLTPAGYQVVGVQGRGPMHSYEFQRFAYQGQYDLADFIDEERRVRPHEEIRARLSSREFRLLEPRHLQAALTGLGENRGVNLGLVPIRQRDHYPRFRTAFGNLLRLAHLRQDELKQFLLDIHQGDFQQRSIDLETGYSSQYRKVCLQAEELRELKAIADDVRRVLDLARERGELRQQLPGLWEAIRNAYIALEQNLSRKRLEFDKRSTELAEEERQKVSREKEVKEQMKKVLQQIGDLKGRLERHMEEALKFRDYLPDFERTRQQQLETEIQRLVSALDQGAGEKPARVRERIARTEADLTRLLRQKERFAGNFSSHLFQLLPEQALEDLFRLGNPDILGLPLGPEGVVLRDADKFEGRLRSIADRIIDGVYSDEAVEIHLDALGTPDLKPYLDAETLEERIVELEARLAREQKVLDAAENFAHLKARKEALQQEWRQVVERLTRFENFQENEPKAKVWEKERQGLEKQHQALSQELEDLESRRRELREEQGRLAEEINGLERRKEQAQRRVQGLSRPDLDWPLNPWQDNALSLEDLCSRFEGLGRDQQNVARRLEEDFQRIEQRTYGKYLGGSEAETLANLQSEMEALEEREKAAQDLWRGLAASLQNAFKGLLRDLETLQSRIDELNRRLGRISISNLARLKLILREHPEWTKRIRTVVEAEALPLFGDSSNIAQAHQNLGDLLNQHRKVELADLFDLHFEVTSADGQTKRYPHLDSIESNGTTITIKVLVNLILLKGLLTNKEVSIPFYLDEASSLDRDNLSAIVAEARRMGFVAVLASPEAMEAADHLYFLREDNGRVILDPKTALVRIERSNDEIG